MIRALGVGLLICSCAHTSISAEAAKARVKKGAFLLDVRSPGEFAEGHLAGAVNVPVNELEATLQSLPTDRNRDVLLYGGPLRSKARVVLLRAGFAKIEDVQ